MWFKRWLLGLLGVGGAVGTVAFALHAATVTINVPINVFPVLTFSPSSLNFQSQGVGTTSPAQTVTAKNTGPVSLTTTTVVFSGSNSGDFAQSGSCASTTLAAGASCTVSVTFTPSATGTRTATLTINSSLSGHNYAFNLNGTGGGVVISGIPSTFFGAHVEQVNTHWPTFSFGSLGKGNCVQWPSLEPSKGTFTWGALDTYVHAAQSHGVTFMYSPGTTAIPEWATSNTGTCQANACNTGARQCGAVPSNEQDLKDFFTALANKYCTQMIYELWNEPYNDKNMTAQQLVTLTKDEESSIRAACPGAQFLTPSMSGGAVSYAQTYFSNGGPTDVAAATIHIYTNGSAPVDYPESINPSTGHNIYYGALIPTLNQYLHSKPIWMTEGSWGTATQSTDFVSATQQAAFVARYFLIQASLNFQRVYWYEYDNAAFGTLYPPERGDGSSVPRTAYQQVYNWLVGRTISSPCAVGSNGSTWTCGLSGSGGYSALAVWNTNGSVGGYVPPNASSYTQWRDLAGGVHSYTGTAVTIGITPILFESG